MVAKPMKVTMSPTEASRCANNQAPSKMIDKMVIVVAARVSTAITAHQDSTGICAASSLSTTALSSETSDSMRAKLWTNATLPSVSEARAASSV